MNLRALRWPLLAVALVLTACASWRTPAIPVYQDGEIPLPTDYKAWPRFLSEVQRPDAKQVREIWVNPIGRATQVGTAYGNGSVFVMENWGVKLGTDGNPVTGADGKLVKDKLLKVFVMHKNRGNASQVDAALKTGDWAFTAYLPDGRKSDETLLACRGCHIPLASKDFVARYDEHFATRR